MNEFGFIQVRMSTNEGELLRTVTLKKGGKRAGALLNESCFAISWTGRRRGRFDVKNRSTMTQCMHTSLINGACNFISLSHSSFSHTSSR